MSTVVVTKRMKTVEMTESLGNCNLSSLSKYYESMTYVHCANNSSQNLLPHIVTFDHQFNPKCAW